MTNDQPSDAQGSETSRESVEATPGSAAGAIAPGPEVPGEGTNSMSPAGSQEVVDASAAPSWRPADYYAAPRSAARFPRWVPLTCGVVSLVALGFMVAVGAFLRSGGLGKLVAISFGQLNAEARKMFDDEVDAASREEFSRALLAVRDGIAEGTIELSSALPVLQEMQKATRDGRLSATEVDGLAATFEKTLAAPPATPGPPEPPVVDL